MKFQRVGIAAAVCLAAAFSLGAESLWTPGFQGYLSGNTTIRPGDILTVVVDSTSSLSFEASSNDNKSITLEFSGGEFGNLFSFLPVARTGGNQSVKGGQKYSLSSEVAARVVETDAAGKVRVEGSRGVVLQGREEQLSISGWVDPAALGAARQVQFSRLADSRLSFRTFLQPSGPTLSAADIQEVVAALQAEVAAGGAPGVLPVGGAASPAAPGTAGGLVGIAPVASGTTYTLSPEKKTELFLRYINRLADILFQ